MMPDGREQRRNGAGREAPAEAVRGAVTGRLLVLLDDLHLAALLLDHRGVELVGGFDLVIQGLDQLVVGGRGVDAAVRRSGHVEGVGIVRHRGISGVGMGGEHACARHYPGALVHFG